MIQILDTVLRPTGTGRSQCKCTIHIRHIYVAMYVYIHHVNIYMYVIYIAHTVNHLSFVIEQENFVVFVENVYRKSFPSKIFQIRCFKVAQNYS